MAASLRTPRCRCRSGATWGSWSAWSCFKGNVGPPLLGIGDRSFIAGMLSNEPANLIRWIRFPQSVVPGNAMPNMGVSDQEARDIAAYLYTLR